MRRLMLGFAVALVAAGVSAADDKAAAVVKKAIDSHGGADALNKYKAGRFKMAGDISVMGMDLEFTGTVAYNLPDRFRLTMEAQFMGQKMLIEQVAKGDKLRNTVKLGDMEFPVNGEEEKDELKMAAVMQEAEQLTPLLDAKKFTVKAADDEDVNGKKAAVIVVQPKAIKKEIRMFFDKDSGLLIKTAHKGRGPGEGGDSKDVDEESYGSDYKKVNGIQVPTKLLINHDGKKFMAVTLTDYELLEKIEDKEFAIDD
jgi:hypothetical protein